MLPLCRRAAVAVPTIAVGFFMAAVAAAAPSHVVVSEIEVGGATATDEFIELLNPTAGPVNLAGWRLAKRTASGSQTNLLTTFPGVTLGPGQRFLVAHPTGYAGTATPDARYSTQESIAANNTIVLFSDNGQTTVDLVGFGTATDAEGAAAPNPPNGQSLERRTDADGVVDTDSNASDFSLTSSPTPTNAASAPVVDQPTPTPRPSPSADPADAPSTPPAPTPTSPAVSPGDVLINEFVPDPADGEGEWVELVNRTGRDIDLTGWVLEDGAEHQTPLAGVIPGTVPLNFSVVAAPKGNLNNDGDRITIKTASGLTVDDVSYGSWDDGNPADNAPAPDDPAAAARTLDGLSSGNPALDFRVTQTPTRGAPNVVTSSPTAASAGPATLRISELFPNPVGSDDAEFIELTNVGTAAVTLTGWRVADATSGYTVPAAEGRGEVVAAGAAVVLRRAQTKLALNNSGGETVQLFPPGADVPVHEIRYSGSAPEGASWADADGRWQWTTTVTAGAPNVLTVANRLPVATLDVPDAGLVGQPLAVTAEDTVDPDGDRLQFSWDFGDGANATGETASHTYLTPGRHLVTVTVSDGRGTTAASRTTTVRKAAPAPAVLGVADAGDVDGVELYEVFPAPDAGNAEWLELRNTGDGDRTLSGWAVHDASGRSFTFGPDDVLPAHGYLLLPRSRTRLALNNDGDVVTLLTPLGDVADEVEYPAAPRGRSFARDGADWTWTATPTPGAANVATAAPTSTEGSAGRPPSTRNALTVNGTVTAPPGTVGPKVLYLGQVAGAGAPANLRADLAELPRSPLELGDEVRLTGKLRTVQGEPRLAVGDPAALTLLRHGPALEAVPFGEADPDGDLGRLVVADGTIDRKSRGGFTLATAAGETLRVVVPAGVRAAYPTGADLTVTGLLSRTAAGLRLLLRTADDLAVVPAPLEAEPAPAAATPAPRWPYAATTGLGALGLLAAALYRWQRSRPAIADEPLTDEEDFV